MADDDSKSTKEPTRLDKLEQISKISVPVMIPIAIALIGFVGNELISSQQRVIEAKKLDFEYVKIARDTLVNVKPETDPRIVGWAYQTLFALSPTKVDATVVKDLSTKREPLPGAMRLLEIKEVSESGLDALVLQLQASGATDIQKIKQGDKYTVKAMVPR